MPYPLAYAPPYALAPSPSSTQQINGLARLWLLPHAFLKATALCTMLALSALALNGCYSAMPLEENENTTNSTSANDLAYDSATAAFINSNTSPAKHLSFDYTNRRLIEHKPLPTTTNTANAHDSEQNSHSNRDPVSTSERNLTKVTTLANPNTDNDLTTSIGYKNKYKPLEYNKYHPAPLNSVTPQSEKKPDKQERPSRYYYDTYYDYDPFYYDQPWRGLRGTYLSPYYYYRHHHGLRGGLYINLH